MTSVYPDSVFAVNFISTFSETNLKYIDHMTDKYLWYRSITCERLG